MVDQKNGPLAVLGLNLLPWLAERLWHHNIARKLHVFEVVTLAANFLSSLMHFRQTEVKLGLIRFDP